MTGRRYLLTQPDAEFLRLVLAWLAAQDVRHRGRLRDTAAAHFGASPNTLSARLREVGTSWPAEMDRERRRRADLALARDPIGRAADYAEPAGFDSSDSFLKAFRRWTGMTFSEWRTLETYSRQGGTV